MADYELGSRYTIEGGDHLGISFEVELAAGETLKIETTPGGTELLLEEVPAGKVWTVDISVTVFEQDA